MQIQVVDMPSQCSSLYLHRHLQEAMTDIKTYRANSKFKSDDSTYHIYDSTYHVYDSIYHVYDSIYNVYDST